MFDFLRCEKLNTKKSENVKNKNSLKCSLTHIFSLWLHATTQEESTFSTLVAGFDMPVQTEVLNQKAISSMDLSVKGQYFYCQKVHAYFFLPCGHKRPPLYVNTINVTARSTEWQCDIFDWKP